MRLLLYLPRGLIGQRQIVCFSSHGEELIVLDPDWLTSDVIGHLFAHENVTCVQNTGLLRINDLKALFPKNQSADMIRLLTALGLAQSCEVAFVANPIAESTNELLLASEVCLSIPCLDRTEEPQNEAEATIISDEVVLCFFYYFLLSRHAAYDIIYATFLDCI